jgi:hypothetical protein
MNSNPDINNLHSKEKYVFLTVIILTAVYGRLTFGGILLLLTVNNQSDTGTSPSQKVWLHLVREF